MYPSIDLESVHSRLGVDTYRRGLEYAREGRVVRCLWNPDAGSLVGNVRGNRGLTYATTVQLSPDLSNTWSLDIGLCSCPMQVDCKHVAAIVIAVTGITKTGPRRAQPREAPRPDSSAWRQPLDALLPTASPNDGFKTPLAIELNLSVSGQSPTLDARLVRPGKRGGWVAGDLSWSRVAMLRHYGYPDAHVHLMQEFYAAYRASASNSIGYYSYSYADVKTISLLKFESPQLWPLLDEARRIGVRLVQPRAQQDVPAYATAQFCLDITANESGDLAVTPVLQVDGARARPVAFIGSSGHGVVYTDRGLRLARLDKPAPTALQRMALGDEPLVIPEDDAARFAAEYYPRLRHIAAFTSSDESFTPPAIVGPTLVLRADYWDAHELELTWEWAYRFDDNDFRAPVDTAGDTGYRDLDAENRLALSIDAPLERFGLRAGDGTLIVRTRLSGLETMRFATELQPLLAELPGVALEVIGDPADYREAGSSLVIEVTTDAVSGETDWFDLGVTISVEGQQVPFVSVFTSLASGQSHMLLPGGAYFALDKPELVKLRQLIDEARALTDAEEGPTRISRFQAGLFDELAELGVVARQADEWCRQVEGLRALRGLEPAAVPTGVRADLRPYQADGFSWLATLHTHGLGGILADDMGLGKTIQTLALLCHVRQENSGIAPFLVVAPASVVANWATEAARFAPGLSVVTIADTLRRGGADLDELVAGAGIVVTSYALFRLDFEAYAAQTWAGLILDEAQFVKNRQCQGLPLRTQAGRAVQTRDHRHTDGEQPHGAVVTTLYHRPRALSQPRRSSPTTTHKPIEKRATRSSSPSSDVASAADDAPHQGAVAADLPPKQEQILDSRAARRGTGRSTQTHLQRERQKVLGPDSTTCSRTGSPSSSR